MTDEEHELEEAICICPSAALVGLPYHPECPVHAIGIINTDHEESDV